MNKCNKVLTILLMINLIAPMEATVDDKQVNTVQETSYNEVLETIIVFTGFVAVVALLNYYFSHGVTGEGITCDKNVLSSSTSVGGLFTPKTWGHGIENRGGLFTPISWGHSASDFN